MRKGKIRQIMTWFLIFLLLASLTPKAFAAGINSLTKTVSETPNEGGELDITLTVSGATATKDQPLNLLLIIDLSSSMNNTLSGGTTRLQALKNAFAGDGDNFLDALAAKVGDGNLNVDIVTFGSYADNTLGWTNDLDTVKQTISALNAPQNNGTNYEQALATAQSAASGMSDVHVIFLSDGEPTLHGTNASGSGNSCSLDTLNATLNQMKSFAQDANITFRAAIAYATDPSFTTNGSQKTNLGTEYGYRYENVNLLGPAGKDASGTYQTRRYPTSSWRDGSTDQNLNTLGISTIGHDAYQSANNEAELLNSLNAIVKGFNLSNVTITDPMHQTHIKEQIDLASLHTVGKLKVYLVAENGSEKQLTYQTDYTVNQNTIKYLHELKAGETLKAVATVQMSDAPGEIYFEKQAYPDQDAVGNPGFFSNTEATASGTFDQDDYTGSYLNPVFRLNTTSLTITKVNAENVDQTLKGATFTLTRNPYGGASGSSVTRTETYTTGDDGTVMIPNLPYGDYELTETVAPDGFKGLGSPLKFSVNYLGQITSSDSSLQSSLTGTAADGYSATVTNDPNDVTLTVTKNLEGTAKNATDKFPFTLSAEGITSVSKSIGQGEAITITVPYGTTVTVSEDDSNGYTATVNTEDDQTPAITDWKPVGNGYSGIIKLTKDTVITITNTKDAPVVTSFVADTSGTSGIALVSITMVSLGALLIYLKKRHF